MVDVPWVFPKPIAAFVSHGAYKICTAQMVQAHHAGDCTDPRVFGVKPVGVLEGGVIWCAVVIKAIVEIVGIAIHLQKRCAATFKGELLFGL